MLARYVAEEGKVPVINETTLIPVVPLISKDSISP
jgi:hypothetical protein